MRRLFVFEWKKLFRQHSFLFFTVILLLGNLFTLYQYERHTDYYTYFFQMKQQWREYVNGDQAAANTEYYQALTEQAESYAASYEDFLKQIPAQAENLKETAAYQNHNTYLYRNLIKTVEDYEGLSAGGIRADLGIGIRELASYNYGIWFQLIFLFVLSWFVVSAERKKGLFLLTKGTKRGHVPLAGAKLLTMVSAGCVYTALQESGTFLMLGYLYGYGDVDGKIQSISIFRDCAAPVTIGQAMAVLFVVRLLTGMLCTVFITCVTISLRQEGAALPVYAAAVGIEMFLYQFIQISSPGNAAKCVNIFYAWDMRNLFGTYLNLNLFGYPVGKETVMLAAGCIAAVILTVLGLYRFSASCQISSGNVAEKIREKIAELTSVQWRHTRLYLFELRKVWIQQKRGYLLLALLVWCLFCSVEALSPAVYYNPAEGEYHRIITQISGPVTEESLSYIEDQRAELDSMYKELEELMNQSDSQSEFQRDLLLHDTEIREGGVSMVEEQRDALMEKEGDISDKYWIDEKSYSAAIYDYQTPLSAFFIGSAALVLWMSSIEASDGRKGLYGLLYTTKAGKPQMQKMKRYVCITGMLWCMICTLLPQILRYYRIDGFSCMGQRMSDFTMLDLQVDISIGSFLLILFLAKAVLFVLVCGLLLILVRKVQNVAIVIGTGVGCTGLTILLLWYFRTDLATILLEVLRLM